MIKGSLSLQVREKEFSIFFFLATFAHLPLQLSLFLSLSLSILGSRFLNVFKAKGKHRTIQRELILLLVNFIIFFLPLSSTCPKWKRKTTRSAAA